MGIGWTAVSFLFAVGVGVPVLAVASSRQLAGGKTLPPRTALFGQTLAVQSLVLGIALATAWAERIVLFRPLELGALDVGAGVAWLALTLGTLPARWRSRSVERKQRLYALVPRTGRERVLYLGVCTVAAVGEEITYRGVMFALVFALVGSWWSAAALCALSFAVAHMLQGWKSAGIVFVFALGFHLLVRLTGALYVPIAVHFMYDLVAGFAIGIAGQRELESRTSPEPQPA